MASAAGHNLTTYYSISCTTNRETRIVESAGGIAHSSVFSYDITNLYDTWHSNNMFICNTTRCNVSLRFRSF